MKSPYLPTAELKDGQKDLLCDTLVKRIAFFLVSVSPSFGRRQRFCNAISPFLDSTLRDGAQGEGISFSVEDKIGIVRALDELGIAYLEAGNPASNPKELEFLTGRRPFL